MRGMWRQAGTMPWSLAVVSDDAVLDGVFGLVERPVGALDQLGRLLARLPQCQPGAESHQQARAIVQKDAFGEFALDACDDPAGIPLTMLFRFLAPWLTCSGP